MLRREAALDADLLVLDDLFLARQIARDTADELQALLHKRYKLRRSTLITSNRVVADWAGYLGDVPWPPRSSTVSCIAACWSSSTAGAIGSSRPLRAL